MEVVYALIPMMLFFGVLMVALFIWMAKSGQLDDLDGAANSIFMDDEPEPKSNPASTAQQAESEAEKHTQQKSDHRA